MRRGMAWVLVLVVIALGLSAAAAQAQGTSREASAYGIEYVVPGAVVQTVALIGCQATKEWPATAWAACAGGAGTVRVVGTCWHQTGDWYQTLYGPWVFAGNRSYAICQGPGVYMVNATYQT